jgi:hypothetical protein
MKECSMKRISTISICAAALISLAANAHAQSVADTCAQYARQSWPDDYIYNSYQRARQQVYTNCMMEHGLRP